MAAASQHVIWPAERFFWAVLDAEAMPRRMGRVRADSQRLGFLFEESLPCPIDLVQATYVPLADRRYLACGMVRAHLESLPAHALTLKPDRVPAAIACDAEIDLARVNLLTGPCEPAAVRRVRLACVRETIVLALVFMLALWLGALRRVAGYQHAADGLATAGEIAQAALFEDQPPSSQPAALRLLAELRRLRATRTARAQIPPTGADAALALQGLLHSWPREHLMRCESISVAASSITVTGTLPDAERAQAFAARLAPSVGWESRQPQMNATGEGVRLTLRLRQVPAEAPTGVPAPDSAGGGP